MSESTNQMVAGMLMVIGHRDDADALSCLENLIRTSMDIEPDNPEQEKRLLEQLRLFYIAKKFIKDNPGKWVVKLRDVLIEERKTPTHAAPVLPRPRKASRPGRKKGGTVIRRGFDGELTKTVTSNKGDVQVFKRDSKGEFMPVGSNAEQTEDTAVLLKLVADGRLDAIEQMGYKIKKFRDPQEKDD